jgi:orotidine-5'-phosphate decarboxylase
MMINSSRAILYAKPLAENGEDYARCARRAAFETRDAINSHRGRIS